MSDSNTFIGLFVGIIITSVFNLIIIDESTERLSHKDIEIISEISNECNDSEMKYFSITSPSYFFSKDYNIKIFCQDNTQITKSLKRK
jgi:hypothetical protein